MQKKSPLHIIFVKKCNILQVHYYYNYNYIPQVCHAEAFRNKFDPVIKMAKVNPGSSYENIGSTRIPTTVYQVSRSSASWFFKAISLLVPKKKIF